ncbi:hypothetical protein B0H19DRAFT_1268697 [Mycena capillaripes]|nr:hypothetical protein B0H19DRAFT_1268697 [Mycena capillaripes]
MSIQPTSNLPVEILCSIFLLTIPPFTDVSKAIEHRDFRLGLATSPWTISHVCIRWRSVAISYPSLWVHIILPSMVLKNTPVEEEWDSEDETSEHTFPANLLRVQLQRSGNAPLHVEIRQPNPSPQILSTLLSSASRWCMLKMPAVLSRSIPATIHFTSLRCLHLVSPFPKDYSFMLFQTPTALCAPLLCRASIRVCPSPVILPWSQITRYQAVGTWARLLQVLPLMLCLIEADLSIIGAPQIIDADITLLTLQKLFLSNFSHPLPLRLLTPALKELFVHGDAHTALSWLQRAHCHLKRLALTDIMFAPEIIYSLHQLPTVTDIAFTVSSMENLLAVFQKTTLLPNLTELHIYCNGDSSRSKELIQLLPAQRPTLQLISIGSSSSLLSLTLENEQVQLRLGVMYFSEVNLHLF